MAKRWRNSKEYKNWKKKCIKRDGGKCVVTGLDRRLHVHHLEHATYNTHLRYEVSNGVTIHKLVHLIFHILMMGGYRKKCTKKDWKRFLRLFKYIKMLSELMK